MTFLHHACNAFTPVRAILLYGVFLLPIKMNHVMWNYTTRISLMLDTYNMHEDNLIN